MDLLRRLRNPVLIPAGDANLARIRRRRALVGAIGRRITFLKLVLFLAGYVWMLVIPSSHLSRGVYFDENALQPGQVNTYWSWQDVHNADRYLEHLEQLRDTNATSEQRSEYLFTEFQKIGIPASRQQYELDSTAQNLKGINTYAILSSPRTSGAEAMVISASWKSRTNEGDGTLNLRGVATVLALSKFLRNYSLWAKDLIFIISDGYLDGMQAWLHEYHGSSQSNLQAQRLELSSGVIWTALNIDYPGHSLSHLGIFHEGLNGRLPNQDLLNSFQHIARRNGVQVVLHDNIENEVPGWLPAAIQNAPEIRTYASQARNVLRHVGYQASGRGSGVHALFHQFRIDAFTIFAVPAAGPHGFHALGRIVESTLRSMNNLLERLHASFFFYVLTGPDRFIKIGNYLPSAVLISVAMMFGGLQVWVAAGWILQEENARDAANKKWAKRKRPVIGVLAIMISTHFLGLLTFLALTSRWYSSNHILGRLVLSMTTCLGPLVLARAIISGSKSDSLISLSLVLKALNLCLTSTVISIMTVLNFSLAACLAVLLGIPLSITSSSINPVTRMVKYTFYFLLGFGWVLKKDIVQRVVWDWDAVGVWTLPLLCIVYFPLVLQAGLVCLL